ncbi:MAG TPA: hypothetical protein VK978_03145 [Candidatus Saccharimonadales bacterium]|nr:hypothetical protein [Candidatus Saccharimonadales bacterium]
MSEIPVISDRERQLFLEDTKAAEGVFAGVYRTFVDEAKSSPKERRQFIDGQAAVITVDNAREFVQKRFDEATATITPLDRPTPSSEISEKFMQEIRVEAQSVYAGNPLAAGIRMERAGRVVAGFMDRAAQMFEDGEADGLTIKVFFDRMQGFKYGLSLGYNRLVAKADEPIPDEDSQIAYAETVYAALADCPDIEEQDSGSFLHINAQRHLASGSDATERYYISPKLNGEPGRVVAAWADTLKDLGLDKKLYYKVAEGLAYRYDILTAYATPETATEMEQAVQAFSRRCPPDLLSDTAMPSGVEVSQGVAYAPEPHELNTLLRYRGKRTVSYNEFVCAITELSLRRASYDFMGQGGRPDDVTPRMLSTAARPYFAQFVALSGLNPATMKAA